MSMIVLLKYFSMQEEKENVEFQETRILSSLLMG